MPTWRTLILTQTEIERLIDMKTAIRVIAQAFKAEARGEVVMPPKVYLPLPRQSDFRAMPAFLRRPPRCGIKWINVHPHNRSKGLPTVMGTIILNDPETGFPLAILDGLSVTRIRTGAAAGVAANALARADCRMVGLIGCGAQALSQLLALDVLFRLRRVSVWGFRAGEAKWFCDRAVKTLHVPLVPVSTVQEAVRDADLVVTITPSRRPLVRRQWVRAGTHLNAVGADAPGKQELDWAILRDASVFVDERSQAIHGGEINVPIAQGRFHPRQIRGTLGDVLIGRIPGRRRRRDLTVFDSTGIAAHDVALAEAIFRRAVRGGIGRSVRFFRP